MNCAVSVLCCFQSLLFLDTLANYTLLQSLLSIVFQISRTRRGKVTMTKPTRRSQYKKFRAINRSHAEIIIRVREFFEKEKRHGSSLILNRGLDRTAEATGIGRSTVACIKTHEDLVILPAEGDKVKYDHGMIVPPSYGAAVRKIIRDLSWRSRECPLSTLFSND